MESDLEKGIAPMETVEPTNAQQATNPVLSLEKPKRKKHRRGVKHKNAQKPFRKDNPKFQTQRFPHYNLPNDCSVGLVGGLASRGNGRMRPNRNRNRRAKLERSRSTLVPYNTNKFLMEEHMAELSNAMGTPIGRTRDSSFSVDSEDNYFFSLPEDEEEFLTKEFANVYEKERMERLEAMSKQQLIEECVALEDRLQSAQEHKRVQQADVQRMTAEFVNKMREQEERIRELIKANQTLRSQILRRRSMAASPAIASPPSAACPPVGATIPTPMDLGRIQSDDSEDSESDSSSSTSSSSSSNTTYSHSAPSRSDTDASPIARRNANDSPYSSPGHSFENPLLSNSDPVGCAECHTDEDFVLEDAQKHDGVD